MVHVTPLWMLRRVQVEAGWIDATGCVGSCYPFFIVFFLLRHSDIVVFYLDL
jgi:hypothetical protein